MSTINFSFNQILLSDPEIISPGRGAEQWNGQNTVNIPTDGKNTKRLDAYWRFRFTDFCPYNNSENTYDFSAFDTQINSAIDNKQKFSFGIMNQCGGCGSIATINGAGIDYPLYLHNKMQSESPKDWISNNTWIPNLNSQSWINAWTNMNKAINDHINSGSYTGIKYKDIINYIDVRGVGDYGEWTNRVFDGPSGTTATASSLKSIIDATVQSFPNFQCVGMIAMFDNMSLLNTLMPTEVGYYALTTKNNAGLLGWRRDSWGWTDSYLSMWTDKNTGSYNGLKFSTEIMNRYKSAPVVGEPADLGNAKYNGVNFGDLVRQIQFYNVNSFGNGNLDVSANDSIAKNNYRAASKLAGYRNVALNGSITDLLFSNSPFNISMTWQNNGVAPSYDKWNIVYELRSGTNVLWSGISKFNLRLFSPGTSTSFNDNFVLGIIPSGAYDLYLIVKDPSGYVDPMSLGIPNRNSDGSYLVKSGIVVNDETSSSSTSTSSTSTSTTTTISPCPPQRSFIGTKLVFVSGKLKLVAVYDDNSISVL
jgi:hypothetical protein